MAQKKPVYQITLGRIRAAVWLNGEDQGNAWYGVTISRSYNVDGEWKDSASFSRDDLPVVRAAAEMAYAWIWEHQPNTVVAEGGMKVKD
jgi:hypothetical protein